MQTLGWFRGQCKRVFWWFDCVTWSDPILESRNQLRLGWMNRILPHTDIGFCTDGDFAALHPGKLHWLPQGFDEREKPATLPPGGASLLFTGISDRGGRDRGSWVRECRERYGDRFRHVERGLHGKAMAQAIAESAIVLCPDSPVTDRYWSNRCVLSLGYGGFVLHPWCAELAKMYRDGEELVLYRSREDMHSKVAYYLDRPEERRRIARAGMERTHREHRYRDRVEQLMRVVEGI